MANPGLNYFGPTGDSLVDGMTNGYYWALAPDRTLDWSISDGFYPGQFWANSSAAVQYIGAVLATYTPYANIRFSYTGYWANPVVAGHAGSELNYAFAGAELFGSSGGWGQAFFPNPYRYEHYPAEGGDVYFNTLSQAVRLTTYAPGSAGWFLFLHETGHALGLKHPHDGGGTGRPTFTQLGVQGLDIETATIMSYRDDFDWNLHEWDPATPMILDVLALQYLYGKNLATNAGDSTLQLTHSNFYSTYWDASGNDTVSAAGSTSGWVMVLPNWRFSALVDTRAGLARPLLASGAADPRTLYWLAGEIENGIGSA
jgi:hypothetical protein